MLRENSVQGFGMWLALALLAGGCGSVEAAHRGDPLPHYGELVPATDISRLMGRSFVLVAAQGFESDDRIRLGFRADGDIYVDARCNHCDGPVSLSDGRLVSYVACTETVCFGDTGRQESWLTDFVNAKPRVMLEGDFWVRLIGDTATLVFSDRFGDDSMR